MAYLPSDNKDKSLEEQQGGSAQGAAVTSSGDSAIAGGGSGGAIGPQNTAGTGAGGQGSFANIQSYLKANLGQSGTADYLKKQGESAFGQEKQNLQKTAQETSQKAKEQVTSQQVGQDQASKLIQQQNEQAKGQLQKGLGAQYKGPNAYSYGLGAESQRYGQGVQDDQGFNALMGNLYNQAAGGQMSTGQLSLQKQLDQDNPFVHQARQYLKDQYGNLQTEVGKTVEGVNKDISQAKGEVSANVQNLRNYLLGETSSNKKQIEDAVKKFNEEEAARKASNVGIDNRNYVRKFSGNLDSDLVRRLNEATTDEYQRNIGAKDNQLRNLSNEFFGKLGNQGQYATIGVDKSKLYNPSAGANLANIGGVDEQRNKFNFIQGALGGVENITDEADVQGGYTSTADPLFQQTIAQNYDHPDQWIQANDPYEYARQYLLSQGLSDNAINKLHKMKPLVGSLGGRMAN